LLTRWELDTHLPECDATIYGNNNTTNYFESIILHECSVETMFLNTASAVRSCALSCDHRVAQRRDISG
jgi:hypothetical protein